MLNVITAPDIPAKLKLTLAYMANRQGRHQDCHEAIETIAAAINVSERKVQNDIKHAIKLGVLKQLPRRGRNGTKRYVVMPLRSANCAPSIGKPCRSMVHRSADPAPNKTRVKEDKKTRAHALRNLPWKSYTSEAIKAAVRRRDLDHIQTMLADGERGFGWKLGDTSRLNRIALWFDASTKSKPVAWLTAAQTHEYVASEEATQWARQLLKPAAPAIQIASPIQAAEPPPLPSAAEQQAALRKMKSK